MKPFSEIQLQAEERKGGKAALKSLLSVVPPKALLLNLPDDRFLAMMTKVINQAGFRWSVVEKKWPQFEDAFLDFNVLKLSFLSPEHWESYMIDTRIVRHWQKICAVRENLSFVYDESRKRGGFAKLIGGWPEDDQVGLMHYLKKHGSRLGGRTGPRFLRYVGMDAFMLTGDVVLAMQNAGLDIADNPTSQRDLKKVQVLMNQWREQSGLSYTHLSKIAAYSTGINYDNV
ncbi:MAG: 3-methyladenine DNA glycosylase Tag [Granulosicoccus sp.]|jgi:3-methyladenine DNA glycosylase Tag